MSKINLCLNTMIRDFLKSILNLSYFSLDCFAYFILRDPKKVILSPRSSLRIGESYQIPN